MKGTLEDNSEEKGLKEGGGGGGRRMDAEVMEGCR